MTKLQYSLHNKSEYFAALTQAFDTCGAGNRILLMTMGFKPDQAAVLQIVHSLEAAIQRGADVTFAIDARVFLEGSSGLPGPLWFSPKLSSNLPGQYGRTYQIIERLGSYPNARAVVLNQPKHRFSLPFAGRSHIKTAIIDDRVFVGGCNLDEVEHTDMMVSWRDQKTADQLYDVMLRGIKAGNLRHGLGGVDQTIILDDEACLLIDTGVPKQSLIFTNALQSIDNARQWLMITCQYFPNSITAQHLLRAIKRGVKTDIVFSHPRAHGFIGGLEQYLNLAIERPRLPKAMFARQLPMLAPKLHAKLLATDQGIMIGSHNYVRAGVLLGTAEIALKSSNAQLAKQARDKLEATLGRK